MAHAVKFSRYGGPEVLEIVEMTTPAPGVGEVVVEVMAAGLKPGETSIREGRFAREWPARFPAGQGSDFAGFIVRIGSGSGSRPVARRVTAQARGNTPSGIRCS